MSPSTLASSCACAFSACWAAPTASRSSDCAMPVLSTPPCRHVAVWTARMQAVQGRGVWTVRKRSGVTVVAACVPNCPTAQLFNCSPDHRPSD
eukprot:351747-Chlamydomonas_euryale.AAC.3